MTYVALVGLTLVLVRGTVFRSLRRLWPALLECSQCTGMWVGMVAGASGIETMGQGRVLGALLVGCATSLLSMGADAVLLKLLGDPGDGDRS